MGSDPARLSDPHVFKALHEIAVGLGTVRDPADMASFVAESACRLLGGDGAMRTLWDERTQKIRAAAEFGLVGSTGKAAVPIRLS